MYNFENIIKTLKYLVGFSELYDIERLKKNSDLREFYLKKLINHLEGLLLIYRKELHRYD